MFQSDEQEIVGMGDTEGSVMGTRRFNPLATLAAVVILVVGACGGSTPSPSTPAASASAEAAASTGAASPSIVPSTAKPGQIVNVGGKDHIVVRWFVGLGSGTNPQQIVLQQQVVSDFNAQQDKRTDGKMPILLSLEIVQNNTATDILKTEIASGSAPDLIGPVGIKGRAGFAGQFKDMTPLIQAAGYDMSQYPTKLVDTMKDGQTGALLGIPYAVYPSYVFFNKDLFDEAGLKYPPQKVGDKYTMPDGSQVDWTWDTVRQIAMLLSVDKSGKDATQAGFDPANQTQYGFEFQWTEGRRLGSAFGSGSLVAPDGKTAQFPDAWKAGWQWYYDGIWKDHFIATDAERNSDLLAKGNVLSSGHAAMGHMFQWYICCMSADATKPGAFKHWDIAVMPANSAGVTTAPINIDTFTISKDSPVADRAFEAMTYLVGRLDLMALYGGTPAVGDQLKFFHDVVDPTFTKQFPGNKVNWQVAIDMEGYAESPNHEAEMPNYIKSQDDYGKVFSTLSTTEGLDLNKTISDMVSTLQADFSAG
jgi:multiple sugar transport system substrate-binding protein